MKQFLTTICSLICLYSCTAQRSEKRLIREFIENVIREDSVELDKARPYLDIYEGFDKEPEAVKLPKIEWAQHFINLYRENLKVHDYKFDVKAYSEIARYKTLSENSLFKKLAYDNTDKVYYVTSIEHDDIYFMVLVADNKIISFYPHLRQGEDKTVYPYLLNIED